MKGESRNTRHLLPEHKLGLRIVALVVLLIPVALTTRMGPAGQLLACVVPLILTGTYRVSRIVGERFDTRLHVAFVPFGREKCKLPAVVFIHTKYQATQSGWGVFLLFGPLQWLFGLVFDYLMPALGGRYEIWLETAKGREILAWNGYSQQHFESNVELLRNRTGAEVTIR